MVYTLLKNYEPKLNWIQNLQNSFLNLLEIFTRGHEDYNLYTCMHACMLNYVWFFATPWTPAQQAPLSMGFSRQDYWSRLSFPPPGDLPNPGIEPMSPASPSLQANLYLWATWASKVTLKEMITNHPAYENKWLSYVEENNRKY